MVSAGQGDEKSFRPEASISPFQKHADLALHFVDDAQEVLQVFWWLLPANSSLNLAFWDRLYIKYFWVTESRRSQGLGQCLLDTAERDADR